MKKKIIKNIAVVVFLMLGIGLNFSLNLNSKFNPFTLKDAKAHRVCIEYSGGIKKCCDDGGTGCDMGGTIPQDGPFYIY